MSIPNNWGDWRPNLTPHTGDLQATDLIECTMIVGGLPVNTAITGQQIIDAASGGGAAGYYAMYQDNITQTAAVINTGYPIKFRTLDYSNGVSVVSNSRITIANTGVYNLQFSVQLENSSTQEHDVTIWLRKNGVDVTGSSGFVSVASSHGGVHGHVLPAWNYLLDVIGGDYYELVWSVSSTAVTMPYYSGSLPPPSAASAIFTVTQQAGIIAGTGITALNGLSGAVQTISTGTTGTDFNVVSSGTDHKFNIPTASATNRGALSTTDWSTFNSKQDTLISGTNIKTINSTSLLGSGNIVIGGGGLTVGTTAIASGTIGRVLFEGTGNVLQQSAGLSFATANNQLNIGTSTYLRGGTSYLDSFANGWGLYNCGLQSTFYGNNKDIWNVNTISLGSASASARLDVRAAGALSTDLAFRVRNSANTLDIIKVQGNNEVNVRANLSLGLYAAGATRKLYLVRDAETFGIDLDWTGASTTGMRIVNNGSGSNIALSVNSFNGTSNFAISIANGDISMAGAAGTKIGVSTTQKIGFWNATPIVQPTTAVAASTFVVGVGTAVTDASTFDGYTLSQIVKALRNTGILA
jgi:hypothetical protein